MITGLEKADGGSFKVGDTVKLGYIDQSRDSLNADQDRVEEISNGHDEIELGKRKMPSRTYVAGFNFKGTDQQKKVGQLSGGERNRVHLAKMLKGGANVLLLDEPTNDLDVDTLRALEEALLEFAGCVVVVSHDRWFLDRIATHILAFEGDSHVEWFEGNYQDYEVDRHRRLGTDADQPHRIKYKPLIRAPISGSGIRPLGIQRRARRESGHAAAAARRQDRGRVLSPLSRLPRTAVWRPRPRESGLFGPAPAAG